MRIEPRRLTVPYQVVRNAKADSIDLVYRYEEDVFLPDDPHTQNLANMVAAQVALNYGLFCDEIVFRGMFDQVDRRFLHEMARNTAREIFVKKFLEPNPFLRGPASKLSAVKRDSYLRARLLFPDDAEEAGPSTVKTPRPMDQTRHLILSSGGKDSLLTFGLLREMGRETHPVFVNESGKHWFTALNAYRHFCKHVPNTARVWTNADRVFSWMLRHLPFVRPDFSSVRSDEYPIRLWTVAVFLFGALPIARKRGAGRIIIGDEFDTTERRSHEGITHYNGLYDQSRYFDNALTRYFIRKKWSIHQFSMLRPMSELLIEKTLVERYPQLFALQVSCHAAHKDGERVRPCGKCEKCRRIVGMLRAIDADPAICGYAPDQVEDCLKALARRGVHQESDGAEHLAFLLSQKGLIKPPSGSPMIAREKPQIMKLRFDPERSPVECVPRDLRTGLYNILLEHTQGAVQRNGRIWMDFHPLSDSALAIPYPFESASE
ncbi:MAG: hypothetical protein JSV78_04770, partial [Phycisphaerales bacterium]